MAQRVDRGDPLPVKPGDLGFSLGVHTHTEVLFETDDELLDWLRVDAASICRDSKLDEDLVRSHCQTHELPFPEVLERCRTQIDVWRITEMTDRFAVRKGVPAYRYPHWGDSETIHVDSKWLLKI
jgi:hypothetical protein